MLELKAKGKISNTHPVFLKNFDIFVTMDFALALIFTENIAIIYDVKAIQGGNLGLCPVKPAF